MDLSAVGQSFALDMLRSSSATRRTSESEAAPSQPQDATTSQQAGLSLNMSLEVEIALNLRFRVQFDASQGTGALDEMPPPETDEVTEELDRPSRRQLRHQARRFLKDLNKSVRAELREFLKETEGLDREDRAAIRELGREFRHDLKDAFRAGFRRGRVDLDAMAAGVEKAFGNLIEGVEAVAGAAVPAESNPEVEAHDPVSPLRIAHRFVRQIDRAVRRQIGEVLRGGDLEKPLRSELKDLVKKFSEGLRDAEQAALTDGGFNTHGFLEGLHEALGSLASGIEGIMTQIDRSDEVDDDDHDHHGDGDDHGDDDIPAIHQFTPVIEQQGSRGGGQTFADYA